MNKIISTLKNGIGKFVDLVKKAKHKLVGVRQTSVHDPNLTNDVERSRFFSQEELPQFELTQEDYIRLIPEYKRILELQQFCKHLLGNYSTDSIIAIDKLFPCFYRVSDYDHINKTRFGLLEKTGMDYAVIFTLYGNELYFLYDFESKNWFIMDNTYHPSKEYKVLNNDLLKALEKVSDPETNELLKYRLEKVEEIEKNKENGFDVRGYCDSILKAIRAWDKNLKYQKSFSYGFDNLRIKPITFERLRELNPQPSIITVNIRIVEDNIGELENALKGIRLIGNDNSIEKIYILSDDIYDGENVMCLQFTPETEIDEDVVSRYNDRMELPINFFSQRDRFDPREGFSILSNLF